MQEHYAHNLSYRTNTFSPEKITLVFIHGVGGSSSAWAPYEKLLQDTYNIFTFDLRGHGLSKKYKDYDSYAMKALAEDVHGLLDSLHIKKFILISHSLGTLVAADYIALYPEEVTGIVFLSHIIDLHKEFSAKFTRPLLSVVAGINNLLSFSPRIRGRVNYAQYPNTGDWNIPRCIADIHMTTLRIHVHCLKQSFRVSAGYAMEAIRVPTMIIHGVNDTMAPVKNASVLASRIPNAEVHILEKTDHTIVHNNSKEIVALLEVFIAKNRATL